MCLILLPDLHSRFHRILFTQCVYQKHPFNSELICGLERYTIKMCVHFYLCFFLTENLNNASRFSPATTTFGMHFVFWCVSLFMSLALMNCSTVCSSLNFRSAEGHFDGWWTSWNCALIPASSSNCFLLTFVQGRIQPVSKVRERFQ